MNNLNYKDYNNYSIGDLEKEIDNLIYLLTFEPLNEYEINYNIKIIKNLIIEKKNK